MNEIKAFWGSYGETVVIIVACVLAIILFVMTIISHKKGVFSSKLITNGAITIALSMVLNLITLYSMPNGGSVTLARLVPLLVFAYVYGLPSGCVIGALYGLLDFMMKPYFLNIIQFLFDYPFAFAGVGFGGLSLFKNNKHMTVSVIFGAVLAGLARWAFSSTVGTLYWGLPLEASMIYNSVLLIDMAVCIVVLEIMFQSKAFVRLLNTQKSIARKQVVEQ